MFSPLVLFFLIAMAVGVIVAVQVVAASKRRERLFAAAAMRGWTFTREAPELVHRWSGQPFGRGDNRRARDVLSGTWRGHDFVAFAYSYETSSTDSKGDRTTTTHTFGVLAWSLPAWLPTLEVRPENILHRAAGAVGLGSDIELESEDFNRAFRVRGLGPEVRLRRAPSALDGAAPRGAARALADRGLEHPHLGRLGLRARRPRPSAVRPRGRRLRDPCLRVEGPRIRSSRRDGRVGAARRPAGGQS